MECEQMRIGIDLDSTLNNLLDVWVEEYNRHYSDALCPDEITDWGIHQFTKDSCGLKVYDLLKKPGLFMSCEPVKMSQQITKWLSMHHELWIVTASEPNNIEEKAKWIDLYYPHIGSSNIIMTRDKSLIHVDVLIDDGWHHIHAFPGIGLLMDMPHNRKYNCERRMMDWMDVFRWFQANTKGES